MCKMSILRAHESPAAHYKRPGYETQEVIALPSPANTSWQPSVGEKEPAQQHGGVTRGSDNDARPRLSVVQRTLDNTSDSLDSAASNIATAATPIRDAEAAADALMMTRNQILLQVGVAALAQANQLPQTVLQLLR
jgi:hypothetical protein